MKMKIMEIVAILHTILLAYLRYVRIFLLTLSTLKYFHLHDDACF